MILSESCRSLCAACHRSQAQIAQLKWKSALKMHYTSSLNTTNLGFTMLLLNSYFKNNFVIGILVVEFIMQGFPCDLESYGM